MEKNENKAKQESIQEIHQKIAERQDFQREGWSEKNLILELLAKAGFVHPYEPHTVNSKAYGGQFFFQHSDGTKVDVLLTSFLGAFISVRFYQPL